MHVAPFADLVTHISVVNLQFYSTRRDVSTIQISCHRLNPVRPPGPYWTCEENKNPTFNTISWNMCDIKNEASLQGSTTVASPLLNRGVGYVTLIWFDHLTGVFFPAGGQVSAGSCTFWQSRSQNYEKCMLKLIPYKPANVWCTALIFDTSFNHAVAHHLIQDRSMLI